MRYSLSSSLLASCLLLCLTGKAQQQNSYSNNQFKLAVKDYGLAGIWKTGDQFTTNYISRNRLLGELMVRYKKTDGSIDSVNATETSAATFILDGKTQAFTPTTHPAKALQLTQNFELKGGQLDWQINLQNTSNEPLVIEDLAIPLFYNSQGGENPKEIFEQQVIKHHYVSGNNSYLFWERPTGVGPYLLMTPTGHTSLEYFAQEAYLRNRRAFQVYIHSAYTASKDSGSWRQPNTSVTIPANGKLSYGFRFQWANNYQHIRDILVKEGMLDVHVAPGMTVPNDLEAQFALRTNKSIQSVMAEFPEKTTITYLGQKQPGTHLYKVRFNKLGENKLDIVYDGNKKTSLEFFSTEPLEVLYKKRAAFIVNKEQHRDGSKWYNGLFSQWDMQNKVLRGPDNAGGFDGRLVYVLTCDDPGLCKAPFLAAKNVIYPNKHEISAIEYYIENFVWGKLQRTDKEFPNPYGVYGTPNWKAGRDTAARMRNTADTNRAKMHIWRSYDYPHIMMLYYHMYQIAKRYPTAVKYADSKRYLELAKETAKAYFIYPYEILPWYETYKWGCYNELLLPELITELEKEGYKTDADWLRGEWEKKVKYFVYDDPYPFRSEYAVDATAFESSQALAAYGATTDMKPDSNLWYDKNKRVWYSHKAVSRDSARRFMDRQIEANIALRGWLETGYNYYGSDFRGRSDFYNLSYMSQMGGWALLDYALNYATKPADYLRLGYASYLSSFALMNTGQPQDGYGFWYPGEENDGASGWAYEPLQSSTNWIQRKQGRGVWTYDGEIDLGYGGAIRGAATIVAEDPIFGVMAFGGDLLAQGKTWMVVPKDGIRTRLSFRLKELKIDISFSRDGFATTGPVSYSPVNGELGFFAENRSQNMHDAEITVTGMPAGNYELLTNNKRIIVAIKKTATNIKIPMAEGTSQMVVIRKIQSSKNKK